MPGPADYRLNDYELAIRLSDLAGTTAHFVPVPFDGEILDSQLVIEGAVDADSEVTLSKLPGGVLASAVAVGQTHTALASGSAAGLVTEAVHTGANRFVRRGDSLRAASDGGSSASAVGILIVRIRR